MNNNEQIPKVIHYCWFGGSPLPLLVMKCMHSWKTFCPSYEIKEWNEMNFDVNCNQYVREAYENKKWAFVTDYVRLKTLYDYGGIYMDTDVEVIKPLDKFLSLPAFSGYEGDNRIPTGIIGAAKGNKWIGELLKDYNERKFIKQDGSFDMTTNVQLITDKTKILYNIELNNTKQETPDFFLYPFEWFCAKSLYTGKIIKTNNTYTIHHFSGSWMKLSQKFKIHLTRLIGKSGMKHLSNIKWLFLKGKRRR